MSRWMDRFTISPPVGDPTGDRLARDRRLPLIRQIAERVMEELREDREAAVADLEMEPDR